MLESCSFPFVVNKKPTVIGRLDTQCDADVLQQNRTTAEAVAVSADCIETEGRMHVAVLVMRWIGAWAAQPVALLNVTLAYELVTDCL